MSQTKNVAGFDAPAGISDELARGISRYSQSVAAIGGYGVRIRAMQPDGSVREGELIELGFGGCQPGLRSDDGRRYRVGDRYVRGELVHLRVERLVDGRWIDVDAFALGAEVAS